MSKAMPVILWCPLQQAITLEKIHMPLKVNLPMFNEIDEDQDTSELNQEIEAVQAQMNQLNFKKSLSNQCF